MSLLWPARNPGSLNYISGQPASDYIGKNPRQLVILGSTGSIGRNALNIAANTRALNICGLAAGENIDLLLKQALQWKPRFLAVKSGDLASKLSARLPDDYAPEIFYGQSGYAQLASLDCADCVLSAQAGSAGLVGTLAAALAGKVIALANKESLVMAGGLIRQICQTSNAVILPVDSEHYAIFQCLAGNPGKEIKKIILTASGGPFVGKTHTFLENISPENALKHPKWKMGAKISIDSATLMNKGLELIEAMHLFGVPPQKVSIVIHPQSVIHSLVEFGDNSILAQMGAPDMRLPIAACLLWPERQAAFAGPLSLVESSPLTFLPPDLDTFKCLAYAIKAAESEPGNDWKEIGLNPCCIALNKSNEQAVERFLAGECSFQDIAAYTGNALQNAMRCPRSAPALPAAKTIVDQAVQIAGLIAAM